MISTWHTITGSASQCLFGTTPDQLKHTSTRQLAASIIPKIAMVATAIFVFQLGSTDILSSYFWQIATVGSIAILTMKTGFWQEIRSTIPEDTTRSIINQIREIFSQCIERSITTNIATSLPTQHISLALGAGAALWFFINSSQKDKDNNAAKKAHKIDRPKHKPSRIRILIHTTHHTHKSQAKH